MSKFREKFIETFGLDFPGHANGMALPRLRFELAAGQELNGRLQAATSRARSIFDTLFDRRSEIWLELTFWPQDPCAPSGVQIDILAEAGLIPQHDRSWEREVVVIEEDGEEPIREERCSVQVSANSRGIDATLKAVCWADHGGWQGLSFRALAFDPAIAVGFYPYDDRGLDVFAAEDSALVPIYNNYSHWIID